MDPIIFYNKYHKNRINILIHKIFVPILIITFLALCNKKYSFYIYLFYNFTYFSYKKNVYDVKLFSYLGILYLMSKFIRTKFTPNVLIFTHILSWIAQFLGHFIYEKNSPALFTSFSNSILWAPLAIYLHQ